MAVQPIDSNTNVSLTVNTNNSSGSVDLQKLRLPDAIQVLSRLIDKGEERRKTPGAIESGLMEPYDFTNLIDDYRARALLQSEKGKAEEDLKSALKVVEDLLGTKPSLENVKKKFGVNSKITEKAVKRAYYMALVSAAEIYLAQEKFDEAEKFLPEIKREEYEEKLIPIITELESSLYFRRADVLSLMARIFQVAADISKAQRKFDDAQKMLDLIQKELPGRIEQALKESQENLAKAAPNSNAAEIQEKEIDKLSRQLKELNLTLAVSLIETLLGREDFEAALKKAAEVFKPQQTDVSQIKLNDIQEIVKALPRKKIRDDIFLRLAFGLVDSLKGRALGQKFKFEQLDNYRQVAEILKGLESQVKQGEAEYFRLKVSLAEVYAALGKNNEALELLQKLPQAQKNFIPRESFAAMPEREWTEYTIRANLALARALNNQRKFVEAEEVMENLQKNISPESLNQGEKTKLKEGMDDIRFYAGLSKIGFQLASMPSNSHDLAEVTDVKKKAALGSLKILKQEFDNFKIQQAEQIETNPDKKDDVERLETWLTYKIFDAVHNFEIGDNEKEREILYAGDYESKNFGRISRPREKIKPNPEKPLDEILYDHLYDLNIRLNEPKLSKTEVEEIRNRLKKDLMALKEKETLRKLIDAQLKNYGLTLEEKEIEALLFEYEGSFSKILEIFEVWEQAIKDNEDNNVREKLRIIKEKL